MTEYPAFPRIEGLLDLERRNGVDVRPTLLRVLTDLYIQTRSHTPDEEAQYVELALRLIDTVDAETRHAVAARLAAYPRAPQDVIRRLAEFGVASEVASPPLAPHLPDIRNAFFAATSYERQMILTTPPAGERAEGPAPAAVETCKRLEAAALERNVPEFTQLLESALLLPTSIADKIVTDPLGEPVVIAAKALGMPADALQRILLLLNPAIGQSVQRVYELAALYDEISVTTADSMIAIWRGRAPQQRKPAPTYQPATYDDETVSARAAATPQRYQNTNRRSDSLATRFRYLGR
jgi:uncharacterized protein (DUF2336 family)